MSPNFANTTEATNETIQPPFDVVINKNDENSDYDEKQLLTFVPKAQRGKAKELLQKLDDHPYELTWNSTGIVFIYQVAVPESNIFKLFPLLYQKGDTKLPGFDDIIAKIYEMGLSHLITRKKTAIDFKTGSGIPPKVQWWYIGD